MRQRCRSVRTLTGRGLTLALCAGLMLALGASGPKVSPEPSPVPTDASWSYLPLRRPAPPAVADRAWVRNDIDRFVLARIERAGLRPGPEADRRTLIRRATYDLTGLPPTPEEVEAFLADEAPDAYERLIDRLLADPQYGVKWGRHWLDLVRWAETDSYERDRVKPGAWRYRDWVVEAFNADMPYDRFVTMQLAGDELPESGLAQHVATGFLHLGIRDDEPTDPLQALYDDLDGMLDTTSRVFLGVSMGCARCHDHKADPISEVEYYSMLSFFEGLKPYKVGFGNSINTENFVRMLPADLGTGQWEAEVERWRREREERLAEVRNTVGEIRERFGEEALAPAQDAIDVGLVRRVVPGEGGVPPAAAEGRRGPAMAFTDGRGVRLPRPVAESFTIAFWFRADEPGAGDERDPRWFRGSGLVDAEVRGIVDDFGIALVGGRVAAGVGNPETFVAGPPGYADGRWHHVAFTRDASTGHIALWLDGLEVDGAAGGTQPLDAAPEVSIGRMQPGYNTFAGLIEGVSFWDRPLAPREVLDLAIDGGAAEPYARIVAQRLGAAEGARLDAAVERLLTLQKPGREMVQVLSAQELPEPMESFVRVRGTASVKGEPVRPAFPEVLGGGRPEIVPPADNETSGRRLALARWITDPDNPRTARVMANRLWQHHFGRGIVRSPNDFGELGDRPTHPDLLDWLAAELIEGGWRLKRMHRLIMTSAAYRTGSLGNPDAHQADPVNDFFARFDQRRLTAEEIRDSMLAVNGTLNPEMGGPGVYPELPEEILATASRPDEAWGRSTPDQAARRSIYIHAKRSLLNPLLTSFDLADTDLSCPVRFTTTQPTQALTMLNSDFVNEQADLFARRIRREVSQHPEPEQAFVRRGLALALVREPEPSEVREGVRLIQDLIEHEGLPRERAEAAFCLVVLNLNEFIYLD
jgi:hypothetical protein